MKRILTLTLALAMSLSLLTACGSSNDSTAPSGDDGSDTAGETVTDRSTVSKIAVLLPGSITDESWNQTAYEGLQQIEEMGYETAYTENVGGGLSQRELLHHRQRSRGCARGRAARQHHVRGLP